ncbi:MAG TPA: YdcF family protein [Polyangiaceae bacterium]|nr:YdcF family protein [Polyangiaceae bacterium]
MKKGIPVLVVPGTRRASLAAAVWQRASSRALAAQSVAARMAPTPPIGAIAAARPLALPPDAPMSTIVVLGCRVRLDAGARLAPGALARRVEMGARTYLQRGDARTVIVVSGGRRWGDEVEADAMARELALHGVPAGAIVRERCSLSTRENARFTAEVLGRRGAPGATLVTCPWHMARAVALFSRAGVAVEPVPATGVEAPWPSRAWRWGVERVLTMT